MGTDKGLILRHGKRWSELAAEKLLCYCEEVYFSIHPGQEENYRHITIPRQMIADDPIIGSRYAGPLAAVLSASGRLPGRDLFLLACDLPDMDPALLGALAEAYRGHPGYSCFAYSVGGRFEPLAAIYTSKILRYLPGQEDGHPPDSLQQLLQRTATHPMPLQTGNAGSFKNYNDPSSFTREDYSTRANY